MIPWEKIDEASTPDGERLELFRRGSEWVIRVAGQDLMGSRTHGSEKAMAELVCERLSGQRDRARVLVGGLGMGFTLSATLDNLGSGSSVVVVELSETVVEWNRAHLGHLCGDPLHDARVELVVDDVAAEIRRAPRSLAAILLDVDNGPDQLTAVINGALYTKRGIRECADALIPGGILAVWSAFDDPRYTARLRDCGLDVELVRVRAHGKKGRRHFVWLATKRG